MLKLSKLSDYAVVIISNLNNHREEPISASTISQETKLPEPTVAKVLKLLASGKIVTSIRGVKGGYVLAQKLEDISIKDVITALEGPIALTACVEDAGEGCDLAPTCAMHGRWNRVNAAIKDALDAVSIADMMQFERLKQRA